MSYICPSVVTAAPASCFLTITKKKRPSTCTSRNVREKKTGTDHQLQQSRMTSRTRRTSRLREKVSAHHRKHDHAQGGGGWRRLATSQVASTRVFGNITSIGKIKCAKTNVKSWKNIFTLSGLKLFKICLKQQFYRKWKFSRHPLKSEALQQNNTAAGKGRNRKTPHDRQRSLHSTKAKLVRNSRQVAR